MGARLAILILAGMGCDGDGKGGRDDGTAADTDADADADADGDGDADADADSDADTDPDWFEPAVVVGSAWFGYDADAGTVVDVITPYGTVESRIRLEVGDAAWKDAGFDTYATDLYCVVELSLTDGAVASWASADPAVWYGVDYTGAPPDSDCDAANGYDIDPASFSGFPDYASSVAARGWGIGVGEQSEDPEVVDYLAGYPYAVIPAGALFGGYVQDGFLGPMDRALAVAFPIDADGIVDHTSYLTATEAHPGGVGLASAYVEVYFLYYVIL